MQQTAYSNNNFRVLYGGIGTVKHALNSVSPEWLYNHYSPLHETSLGNAWEKASCACMKES